MSRSNFAFYRLFGATCIFLATLALASCGGAGVRDAARAPESFRDVMRDGSVAPEMVWISAGTFRMGDLQGDGDFDEKPVHDETIPEPFAMSRYEITVSEFRAFVDATHYVTDAERGDGCMIQGGTSWREPRFSQTDDHPVVCVSWNDGVAYVNWLREQTGRNYRLPTEAEWEYAARAGTTTRFTWGDAFIPERANCWGCLSADKFHWTLPVGSFAPNAFGLYDMEGNVWELTASEWTESYRGHEEQPSFRPGSDGSVAIRSGGWFNGPSDIRPANRAGVPPDGRYNTMGIRVVRAR